MATVVAVDQRSVTGRSQPSEAEVSERWACAESEAEPDVIRHEDEHERVADEDLDEVEQGLQAVGRRPHRHPVTHGHRLENRVIIVSRNNNCNASRSCPGHSLAVPANHRLFRSLIGCPDHSPAVAAVLTTRRPSRPLTGYPDHSPAITGHSPAVLATHRPYRPLTGCPVHSPAVPATHRLSRPLTGCPGHSPAVLPTYRPSRPLTGRPDHSPAVPATHWPSRPLTGCPDHSPAVAATHRLPAHSPAVPATHRLSWPLTGCPDHSPAVPTTHRLSGPLAVTSSAALVARSS